MVQFINGKYIGIQVAGAIITYEVVLLQFVDGK